LFSILDKQGVISKISSSGGNLMANIEHKVRNDCKSEAEAISQQRVGLIPYSEVNGS